MRALSQTQFFIAENVLLDARLALFHVVERWLAIADLHFGFELSQRAAGWMVPLWGMDVIHERLFQLIADYHPRRLIVVGDLVHDKAGVVPAKHFLTTVSEVCEVILIAGNHDRDLDRIVRLMKSFSVGPYRFHHGDCDTTSDAKIQIIGHFHPAGVLRDGAGLRLKLPAFIQERNCWILPAFSPWAAGTEWPEAPDTRVWLCTPERILPVGQAQPQLS